MVFITKAVFNKLCRTEFKIPSKIPDDLFREINFRFGVDKVLSEFEYNMLYHYYYINSQYYDECLEKRYLAPRTDTLTYVFEPIGAYKYHLYDNCVFLHNNFYNYIVPPEVKNKGVEMVNLYRLWFQSNGFDKIDDSDIKKIANITFRYNTSFALIHNLKRLNENYQLIVNIQNSTYVNPNSYFSLINVERKIKLALKNYFRRFPSSNTNVKKAMEVSYMLNYPRIEIESRITSFLTDKFITNYGYEKLIDDFKYANYQKNIIIHNLKIFMNWRCDFKNNNFSKEVLEGYGLICCRSCYNILHQTDILNSFRTL